MIALVVLTLRTYHGNFYFNPNDPENAVCLLHLLQKFKCNQGLILSRKQTLWTLIRLLPDQTAPRSSLNRVHIECDADY